MECMAVIRSGYKDSKSNQLLSNMETSIASYDKGEGERVPKYVQRRLRNNSSNANRKIRVVLLNALLKLCY
jgi:hypothetical protein